MHISINWGDLRIPASMLHFTLIKSDCVGNNAGKVSIVSNNSPKWFQHAVTKYSITPSKPTQ